MRILRRTVSPSMVSCFAEIDDAGESRRGDVGLGLDSFATPSNRSGRRANSSDDPHNEAVLQQHATLA